MRVAGLVLAGGQSRRMGGGDKSLRSLGGRAMIAHVIDRLAPQVGPLAISSNADPAAFRGFGPPVLPDGVGGFAGPLAGILAGMDWAARDPALTHLATAATDTPYFPRDLVARLCDQAAPGRIVLARSFGRRQPVFGLWPLALRDDLADWLARGEPRKVQAWAERHALAEVDFTPADPAAPDPFFNANTPEEFAQAEAMLAAGTA
ncbi:MAG: molybdenum cofactor guanylyltransferase MobA [Rhodobacteraceae bacterium]|nr:molybdenum cofactor guanylyltransferase MobA [Paracoccaceae bacterium]